MLALLCPKFTNEHAISLFHHEVGIYGFKGNISTPVGGIDMTFGIYI